MVSRCLPESAHWRGTDRETGFMGSDEPHEGGCTRHIVSYRYIRRPPRHPVRLRQQGALGPPAA